MIAFPKELCLPIRNHKTDEVYQVVRADAVVPIDERIAEVVAISNETEVYERLFRTLLEGKPYPEDKARDWFQSIQEDWRANTHFRFFVLDGAGAICAACGIKSNDVDGAEMGYLCSVYHTGIMTNAVVSILAAAKAAGFRSIMCRTKRENVRSKAVMLRAGFVRDEDREGDAREYFVVSL